MDAVAVQRTERRWASRPLSSEPVYAALLEATIRELLSGRQFHNPPNPKESTASSHSIGIFCGVRAPRLNIKQQGFIPLVSTSGLFHQRNLFQYGLNSITQRNREAPEIQACDMRLTFGRGPPEKSDRRCAPLSSLVRSQDRPARSDNGV